MAEPVIPAGFKVIDDSVPEGFELEPSLLDRGLNTLRGVVGIPRRAYEEVALPFAENITSQTLGLIDAGTTGAVVGRNYLQDLIATGSFEKAYELAKRRDPGVPQLSKLFTPSSEFSKSAADISGKIWAAPAEIAGEAIDLPLESVKAPEYVRGPVKAVGELASYPAAIGGVGTVKGLVRKYLPEAVQKVSNEKLLKDRAKLGVKENIETSAEAREARTIAQEYNKQRTSAEMENFAEEKLRQLQPTEESPVLIEARQPVSEFTPKESTSLQSQAVDIVGQLKDTLPTWEVDRLNELSQKSSFDWTPEDRLFFKEKQGQIKDLPVEEVTGRAGEPPVPEGFSLVDEFGRKIDSSSSIFREPERSKIDEVTEKGVEQNGKVQAKTEAEVGGETYTLDPVEPVRIPTRGYMPRGEAGTVLFGGARPGFYSKVEDLVTFKMSGKMDADQLRSMLKNNGATDAEIQSTLGELKGSVTKQQVLDEIAANKTELKDVVLGGSVGREYRAYGTNGKEFTASTEYAARKGFKEKYGVMPTEVSLLPEDLTTGAPKFSPYQEPGAVPGSYREMFVTAPAPRAGELKVKAIKAEEAGNFAEAVRLEKEWNKGNGNWEDGHSAYSDIQNPIVRIRFNERRIGGKEVKTTVRGYDADKKFQEFYDYGYKVRKQNGYSDMEAAQRAHGEAQQLTDKWIYEQEKPQYKGGKRILFVEEIQGPSGDTKWRVTPSKDAEKLNKARQAQESLEKFYGKPESNQLSIEDFLYEEKTILREFGFKKTEELADVLNPITKDFDSKKVAEEFAAQNGGTVERTVEGNQGKMPPALQQRIYDIGVKRVLAYAKENGFDGVAWTTGKMQADRYSLAKQLDSVQVDKAPDGSYRVWGNKDGQTLVHKEGISAEELPNVIGKELAVKAIEQTDKSFSDTTRRTELLTQKKNLERGIQEFNTRRDTLGSDSLLTAVERIDRDKLYGRLQHVNLELENLMPRVRFEGLDLEVGGEGLKTLYDKTLPALFKKYGKEGVGEVKIETKRKQPLYVLEEVDTPSGRMLEVFNTETLADRQQFRLSDRDNAEFYLESMNQNPTKDISVPYTPITSKTPSSYPIYMGVNPLDLPNVVKGLRKNARELWEEHKALAAKDRGGRPGIVGDTVQAFREFFKEPERVLNKEEAGKKIFKELATAEESVNAFIYRNFKEYEKATRGIKKGSKEAEQIGRALDGQISRDQLTQNEQRAYDFLKQNFEAMIVEYARKAAGSEEAYRRVVQLVGSKIEKQTKVKDLSPELRAEYDDLYKQAKELRGDKKVSELTGDDKVKYEDLRQEMRDLLSRDFRKKLPEGEAEAYDILSRKIKDYLPHMFEKEDLIAMFIDDIARSKKILETATNKGLITRTKNRIVELEKAVTKMQGGGLVTFNQLPSEIFFRFFQPRKGKQGYSFDALQAYETYLFGIARKMFDEPALKKISQEHFNNLSPELKPYAQEFVDHYFGYDRYKGNKLASAITSLEWMRTLGLNPRSAIVNLTQRINTLAWVGEKYAVTAEKMMLEDLALKIKDKTTGKEREYTSDKIFEESGIAREVPNVLTEGPMPKGMEALRSIVGFMFNKIELGNRKHAYLSGYLKGLDLGKTKNLTGDALEAFAKKEAMKVVHKTQFRYGKLGMPKAMWNPVGRVALQFSSYPIKQLGFIADMWRKDPKTFLKWFAYAEGINYTMQELFDTDLSNALGIGISFGEALKVVSSLAEGDTKAAYRHLRQTVKSGSGLLPSGPGPMVSGALKVASAAEEGKGGEQLVKELTPIMYTRGKQAVQAIEGERDGEYPILDDKGHPMYRLSARQLAQRTLGPKTAKEGKEQKKWTEERLLEQERRESLSTVVKAYLSGDKDAFRKAVMDNKEAVMAELKTPGSLQRLIENEMDRRSKTRGEREKPTSTKNIFELFRTGDVIQ